MAYVNPLLAMADALYGRLAFDVAVMAVATGGVHYDVPQNPTFPFVWFEVHQEDDHGGYGSQPGRRSRPEIHLRVHVFQSDYGTAREAQIVMGCVADALWNAGSLVVEGYTAISGKPLPRKEEIYFADEELRGVKVKEAVLVTDYIIEEVSA